MTYKNLAIVGTLTLLTAIAHAGSASKELYGKSVVLTWSEGREGNVGGIPDMRISRGVYMVLTTYISTAGRLFTQTLQGGAVNSHVSKSAVGYEGPGDRSAHSSAEFQGHSLVMTSQFENGARRIVVDFDPTFSTCQGKVMHGRELGKNTMHNSGLNGQPIELRSITVSSVTCAIRDGNALSGS
jgi:hypothetical protein